MKYACLLAMFVVVSCVSNEQTADLIISNVSLIDGTGGEMLTHANVYIKNHRIIKIDSGHKVTGENVLDGTDKYLIPGLFDCHVHTSSYARDFPIFTHFGVTSIFATGGSKTTNSYFAEMRALGMQDSMPAPRVFHTSQHLTMEGRHPVKTYSSSNWVEGETVFYLRDTVQITAIIDQLANYPILGVKLTIEDGPAPPFVDRIPQVLINKVAREAHNHGLQVYAHVSDNLELSMALKAGIKNILHFTGVDLDFENGTSLVDSIYNSHISWVTTLMLDKSFIYALYPEWMEEVEQTHAFDADELKLYKDPVFGQRAREHMHLLENFFGIENPTLASIIVPQVEEISELYEHGVNMVLGTDTGNNFIFPGYSLHEEMQLMELGGMKPLDIITMSTRNAARMMNALDSLGTLEEGKLADMILLDKNPLDSIKNTLSINIVIKNGIVQQRLHP